MLIIIWILEQGAAYWSWTGTDLNACCGPDASFSDDCACAVTDRPVAGLGCEAGRFLT